MVKILSVRLPELETSDRRYTLEAFENEVNEFIKEHQVKDESIKWFQSSGAGQFGDVAFTQLTAIITY